MLNLRCLQGISTSMTDNHHSAYYTSREAALKLNVSLRTVQLWVDRGILEAWKTEGGHRRISVDSVDRMLRVVPQSDMKLSGQVSSEDRLKLMVVDDDGVLLKLYKKNIGAWNVPIDVFTCSNGWDALLLLGRELPDLLVVDLMMPGMDGFMMLRALSSTSLIEGMEIVVVTGLDNYEIAARGGLPDSVSVFSKPIPFTTLKGIAERILKKHAAFRQAG